jgi:hypothetical protein
MYRFTALLLQFPFFPTSSRILSVILSSKEVLYDGRNSVLGIATRYGQDGPGSQPGWEQEVFLTGSDRP